MWKIGVWWLTRVDFLIQKVYTCCGSLKIEFLWHILRCQIVSVFLTSPTSYFCNLNRTSFPMNVKVRRCDTEMWGSPNHRPAFQTIDGPEAFWSVLPNESKKISSGRSFIRYQDPRIKDLPLVKRHASPPDCYQARFSMDDLWWHCHITPILGGVLTQAHDFFIESHLPCHDGSLNAMIAVWNGTSGPTSKMPFS